MVRLPVRQFRKMEKMVVVCNNLCKSENRFFHRTNIFTPYMRFIAAILSFLILSLSVMPCSDAETCDEQDKTEQSTHHDHSEDEDDDCSPFCVCGCCGSTYVAHDVTHEFSHILTHFHTNAFSYSFLYSFDYLDTIWQPPKSC